MDTRNGALIEYEQMMRSLPESERKHFVQVNRPITTRELHRMKINKYAPCGCGSGKKFKFCCYKP
jgi:uncharacterized protein YchJ